MTKPSLHARMTNGINSWHPTLSRLSRIMQTFFQYSSAHTFQHVQGRLLSSVRCMVRLVQSESENSLRNRISSDLRKKFGRSFLIDSCMNDFGGRSGRVTVYYIVCAALAREPLCFWQKGLRQATQMVPKLSHTKFQLLNPTGRVRRLSLQLS